MEEYRLTFKGINAIWKIMKDDQKKALIKGLMRDRDKVEKELEDLTEEFNLIVNKYVPKADLKKYFKKQK